jgi:hypothetical protein
MSELTGADRRIEMNVIERRRWGRVRHGIAALAVLVVAGAGVAGCEPEGSGPYVRIEGGGFIFNYRISEAYYGFVARPLRSLPEGSILEARFEDPDGEAPIIVRQPVRASAIKYTFRTPPLRNVQADRDYRAELVVFDAGGVRELGRYEKSFRTYIGQNVIAEKPLTVGPGYTPNPQLDRSDLPGRRPARNPQ